MNTWTPFFQGVSRRLCPIIAAAAITASPDHGEGWQAIERVVGCQPCEKVRGKAEVWKTTRVDGKGRGPISF